MYNIIYMKLKIKSFEINLMKDCHSKYNKIQPKIIKWMDSKNKSKKLYHVHILEDSILLRWTFFSKLYKDS